MLELNKIYQGDCSCVMRDIDTESIDMILTSPPYDHLREYEKYTFDFHGIAKELYRVLKSGGVCVWVVGDATIKGSETGTSFKQALYFKEIGFNLHDTMIYQKLNYVPLTHNRYEQSFEYIFVLSKGRPKTFNPIMIPCKHPGKVEKYGAERRQNFGKTHSMRMYSSTEFRKTKQNKIAPNVFSYVLGRDRSGHPAAFPAKLAEDQILSWTNVGDVVLDPMAGSFVTCRRAVANRRKFIGIEISKKYCDQFAFDKIFF